MEDFDRLTSHVGRIGSRTRRYLLSTQGWRPRLIFWLGAIAVGAAAALFARMAEFAMLAFAWMIAYSSWLALAVTPAGLMLSVWLTRRFFAGAEGSGIPQTIAAVASPSRDHRKGLLSLRVALGKMGLTTLGLASGASIGREGPTVQVGAAILYHVGHWARLPRQETERGLILAGGAAGIAAAFNTPLAGIIFAIEEMSRSFEERTTGTLLLAVIIAGMTALAFNGNYTYFGSAPVNLTLQDWAIVPVCGVVGGILGGLFTSLLLAVGRRIFPVVSRHPYQVAFYCGLAVAIAGISSGGTSWGTGYHEAAALLQGETGHDPWFPVYKLLSTLASYWSGIPGGIFAPSLSIGAGLGADLASWFPSSPLPALIILGMVSYFSGVVQTPITAFVIVMEITGSHDMALPLMAASFIAYAMSRLVCRDPLYRTLARRFIVPPTQIEKSKDNSNG